MALRQQLSRSYATKPHDIKAIHVSQIKLTRSQAQKLVKAASGGIRPLRLEALKQPILDRSDKIPNKAIDILSHYALGITLETKW